MPTETTQYRWLQDLATSVATPKFFILRTQGPPSQRRPMHLPVQVAPPSYRRFQEEIGGARLFRNGRGYRVQVYSSPRGLLHEELGPMWWVGRCEATRVCFADVELSEGFEAKVWEWNFAKRWARLDVTFEEWIRSACSKVRREIPKSDWALIQNDPEPFSAAEAAIAAARKKYSWEVVGIDESDCVLIRVTNGSPMSLAYISLDCSGEMRGKAEVLEGGVAIPTAHIQPGASAVVPVDCYREVVDPRTVLLTDVAGLGPEDRDILWEFR